MKSPESLRQPPFEPAAELELARIRESIASRASARAGSLRVLAMLPCAERAAAESELEALGEMLVYLAERSEAAFPCQFGSELLDRLGISGERLDIEELLAVRATLKVAGALRRRAADTPAPPAPRVLRAMADLPAPGDLLRELDQVFTDDGSIRDSASPDLERIRRGRRALIATLETRLQRLFKDSRFESSLAETYFTQINGRYVVLLRSDAKGRLPGIVQGTSKSGQSLYVEPLEMVERNNDLIRSYHEEEQEIARILFRLSRRVEERSDDMELTHELLTWLDSLAARARWAGATGSRPMPFSDDHTFDLREARHPLLEERCVPIGIRVRPDHRVLVLGGANSGGKTVALKTVGLLHAMAASGFPVPCAEGSSLAFFDRIFCEIGDKQSIDADLSSFSSHARAVARILEQASEGDLVLLDEFMTGTDPQEGSALAEALLLELRDRGCVTVITTHYNSIKLLQSRYEGFQNYAVEFDPSTLRPTYRLLEGELGASAGIEIARRFGIPDEVAERARQLLETTEGNLAAVLSRLEEDRANARARLEEYEREAASAARLRQEVERELEEMREERRVGVGRHIREERRELAALRDFVKEAARTGQLAAAREALQERAGKLVELEREVTPPPSDEPLVKGDRVLVLDLDKEGLLVAVDGSHATVELAGGLPLRTRLESLRKMRGDRGPTRKSRKKRRLEGRATYSLQTSESVGGEVNLIAMRAQEAQERLAWYLDQAEARGLREVRVVHGKGNGVLRRVVEEYLGRSGYAGQWRPGGQGEGDTGVTIVSLAPGTASQSE